MAMSELRSYHPSANGGPKMTETNDPDRPDLCQTPTGWLATRDDFPRIGVLGTTREETEQKFRTARQAWREIAARPERP